MEMRWTCAAAAGLKPLGRSATMGFGTAARRCAFEIAACKDAGTVIYVFEGFELDPARFELRHGGGRVAMEPQVFEVLAYLVANHERAVPKDELIGHVWPERFISDAALNSRVMAARKAVGDNGKDQALIRTIHGRGYRFVGAVQVRADGAPAEPQEPPAPPDVPAIAANVAQPLSGVDAPVTSFVGREDELARLDGLLTRSACRLVTVTGPGGVGKTRLAVEATRRLRARGVEVISVPVQTLESVPDMVCAIAAHLGLPLATGDPAELAARVGDRSMILFLDNVEHLARDGGPAISAMLQTAPNLRVVVTTREVLGLHEEWLFPVAGLSLASGPEGISEAEGLFLAREAQAAGSVGPGEPGEAGEICRLVDGMPLAIELAAALRRYLGRAEIARQVQSDVDFLRADLRNVPSRHRSIPGLLEQSFRRLSVEQMRALLSLSVFEGSFTAESSAVVAEAPLRLLGELVDRSLVAPREGRFALHPLLCQFARDRLGPAYPELQERHSEHFLGLLTAQRRGLEGESQVASVTLIEADWPNFAAAWRFACARRRFDLLEGAAYPAYLFAQLRSRWLVIRPEIEVAIAAIGDEAGCWRLRSELLIYRAWVLVRTTRSAEIQRLTWAADGILAERGALPTPGIGTDPIALKAMIAWAEGRYDRAAEHAHRSIERARATGDAFGRAFALWLLAVAHLRRVGLTWFPGPIRGAGVYRPAGPASIEMLRDAEEALGEASGILEAAGDTWLLSSVRIEQASVAKSFGDVVTGRRRADESLALRQVLDDARGIADAYIFRADLALDQADAAGALDSCTRAEALVRKLGDLGTRAELLRCLARVAWLQEELDAAADLLVECGELSFRVNAVNNVLAVLRATGDLFIDREEFAAGAELHAFVSEHQASTSFSRALSDGALRRIARLGEAELAQVRERVRGYELSAFSNAVFAALREQTGPPAAAVR